MKSTCKVPKATICYWTQEDIEEEGEDEKICILQLLIDYITGDMIFAEFPDMFHSMVKLCFREHDICTLGYIFVYCYYEQPAYLE